jgi:hypothetical protein
MTPADVRQACASDPLWLFEHCLSIQEKLTKKLVPFVLNPEQRDAHDVFWGDYSTNKPVRLCIVKPRQIGFTTWSDGLLYWAASTQAQCRSLIVGNEESTAIDIFETVQRFAVRDARKALGCMPMIRSLSVRGLSFDNPDGKRRMKNPGLDSSIGIRTADNRNAGHGWSGRFLHGTECARWKYPEVLTGLLNAVPDTAGTVVILESTGHGAAGVFFDIFTEAVEKQNEWTPIFISWKDRPEYTVELSAEEMSKFEPKPVEFDLMKRHGLTIEQVAWRRKTIASPRCKDSERAPEDVFREQFPLEWEEAFIGQSRQFFDMHIVAQREETARDMERDKKFKTGTLVIEGRAGRNRPDKIAVKLVERGYLTIWEDPIPGDDYVIGSDVGSGLAVGDFSNAYVMQRRTQRFVARCRSREFYPEFWGESILPALGWLYNTAFIAAEANSIGLIATRKVALVYPRSAFKIRLTKLGGCEPDTDYPGFWQDQASRADILQNLRNCIRHGTVWIPCPIFWAEARTFVVPEDPWGHLKESAPKAMRKKKDDCVMSAAITLKVNDPFLGAGSIRRSANAEVEELDWRRQMLSDSNKRVALSKTAKPDEWDDSVGDY